METFEKEEDNIIHFNNNICRNRKQIIQCDEQVIVKLSVDLIRFSIQSYQLNNSNFYKLFNAIKNVSIGKSKFSKLDGVLYIESRKYIIKIGNKLHKIYALLPCSSALPILLTVHDADSKVLQYLEPYLSPLQYHISWIEYTMDFISKNKDHVYQFMLSYFLLKWPGKKYVNKIYKTSFYRNDLRGSETKGLRGYQKQLTDTLGNTVDSVRIELLAKRKLLKKHNIQTISDFLSSNSSIVIKYITFKKFNYSIFIKRLREQGYDHFGVDQMIDLYISSISNGHIELANETAKNMYIKNDSDTYLVKHEFDKYFMSKIAGLSFVNGDTFSVSLGKLKMA